MPNSRTVRFTFSSTADINFDVVSFELTEGLCELYFLTVDLVSTSANADFAQLLDQPATLTIWQCQTLRPRLPPSYLSHS